MNNADFNLWVEHNNTALYIGKEKKKRSCNRNKKNVMMFNKKN